MLHNHTSGEWVYKKYENRENRELFDFTEIVLFFTNLFSIKEIAIQNKNGYEVYLVDHSRIQSLYGELHEDVDATETSENSLKRKCKWFYRTRDRKRNHW